MTEYDNNMRGVLFKNDNKKDDSQPDYKGKIEVNHEEFWLSAWINTSKAGNKFMSIGLVPHIPDDFIFWSIEDVVKCQCQLNNTKARRKMTAIFGNRGNDTLTYLSS